MYDLMVELLEIFKDAPNMVMNGDGLTVLAYVLGTIFMSILIGAPLNALSRIMFRKGLLWGAPLFTVIVMLTLAVDGKFSLEYILHAGETLVFLFSVILICLYPFMKVWKNLVMLKWRLIKAGEGSKAVYLGLAMRENAWWLLYPTTLLFILYGAMRHKVYKRASESMDTKHAEVDDFTLLPTRDLLPASMTSSLGQDLTSIDYFMCDD